MWIQQAKLSQSEKTLYRKYLISIFPKDSFPYRIGFIFPSHLNVVVISDILLILKVFLKSPIQTAFFLGFLSKPMETHQVVFSCIAVGVWETKKVSDSWKYNCTMENRMFMHTLNISFLLVVGVQRMKTGKCHLKANVENYRPD